MREAKVRLPEYKTVDHVYLPGDVFYVIEAHIPDKPKQQQLQQLRCMNCGHHSSYPLRDCTAMTCAMCGARSLTNP